MTPSSTAALLRGVEDVPSWADRFWAKVERAGDCWEWTGGRDKGGYGAFWLHGQTVRAPRVAWLLGNPGHLIPDGHEIRHSCDNPPCVRPSHLSTGLPIDNSRDRVERQRSATGDRNGSRLHPERLPRGPLSASWRENECRNGHPLSRRYVSPSGERICTDCATERRRRYRAKATAEGRRVS